MDQPNNLDARTSIPPPVILADPIKQSDETPSGADLKKKTGSSYTPEPLAKFVAKQLVANYPCSDLSSVSVMDPAVGGGELLVWLCEELLDKGFRQIHVTGYDTDGGALAVADRRLQDLPRSERIQIDFSVQNFLDHATASQPPRGQSSLFDAAPQQVADIVIANPPYVRTQVLGADTATRLAEQFDLTGRVDLYHAFVLAITSSVKEGGLVGLIVSNRFMTTRAGGSVRQCFLDHYNLRRVWDLGDTKIFNEAVLPAVVIGERSSNPADNSTVGFTSTYSTDESGESAKFAHILDALGESYSGIANTPEQRFLITAGQLEHGDSTSGVWRVSTAHSDKWLSTVEAHQAFTFADIGKVRVGVKTTADKVFIRDDWSSLPEELRPEEEVLRPLITHRQNRRWCPLVTDHSPRILYTHRVTAGKREVFKLTDYPNAARYLQSHEQILRGRKYVTDAGREWFEIWVPQDPAAWSLPKLVFRDIAEQSEFSLDLNGSIVNGDCYWISAGKGIAEDLLWLALAVGNSSFVMQFYDHKFQNRLYAGRRRFMTQYVEQFPLPNPSSAIGKRLVTLARKLHEVISGSADSQAKLIEIELDSLVWEAFGLQKKSDGNGI